MPTQNAQPSGEGKTVLVSGVTGFIGTAVALEYLKHGYGLHATSRSQSKADQWLADHPEAVPKTNFFVVSDVAAPGAFDKAIENVDVVAHTASPMTADVKNPEGMLIPAIEGTRSILESALKTTSVQRVVITSSSAAILDVNKGFNVGHTYSEVDWNPATYDEAKSSDNGSFIYCASKALAERAAWDFVKEKKPRFSLTTICPTVVFGPAMQHLDSVDDLQTSLRFIWELIDGRSKEVPPTYFPVGVDIRDVAKAHYLASSLEVAKGQRYLINAFHYSLDQVAALLAEEYPDKRDRIPASNGNPPPEHYGTDVSKAERELGIQWTPFEQCIKDTAAKLWEIEEKLKVGP